MSNWISIKDKIPPKNRYILVCTKSSMGNKNVNIGRFTDYGDWELAYAKSYGGVTHWMPLSEPPQN